nr:4-hydroxy-4-methyl-2-oxoglutarate aldolase [Quercus suber]
MTRYLLLTTHARLLCRSPSIPTPFAGVRVLPSKRSMATSSASAAAAGEKNPSEQDVRAFCDLLASGRFSACDVSDALLKLKVPQAGFLPDIAPLPRHLSDSASTPPTLVVAPISTLTFIAKDDPDPSSPSNIPSDTHWSDLPAPGSIALLQQHPGQVCAVLGDIMASRLAVRGVRGVVADGRVRDVHPIAAMAPSFVVWSRATSTVGTGLQAKPWWTGTPVRVAGLEVCDGDVMVADERERGCVVVPKGKVVEVTALLPGLKDVDDRCVADVQAGVDVGEAFRRHR